MRFTKHFLTQALTKGFTAEQIKSCLDSPEFVNDVIRGYPGQRRFVGAGVAIVVDGDACITIYADRVVTPLREDQMNDPRALNSRRLNRH